MILTYRDKEMQTPKKQMDKIQNKTTSSAVLCEDCSSQRNHEETVQGPKLICKVGKYPTIRRFQNGSVYVYPLFLYIYPPYLIHVPLSGEYCSLLQYKPVCLPNSG